MNTWRKVGYCLLLACAAFLPRAWAVEEEYYLESTGVEYIKTGVCPTPNTRVVIDYQRNDVPKLDADNGFQTILGANLHASQLEIGRLPNGANNKLVIRCNCGNVANPNWNFQQFDFDDRDGLTIELRGDGTLIVNDQEVTVDKTLINGLDNTLSNAGKPNGEIYLFTSNQSGVPLSASAIYFMSAKLYSCMIYEGEMLIRNFVPYKRGDEAGLRDLCVTGSVSFYGNASGNGGFVTNAPSQGGEGEEQGEGEETSSTNRVTVIGDSYSSYAGTIPARYEVYYPTYSATVSARNQMYWQLFIDHIGGSLSANCSWSGSMVGLGQSEYTAEGFIAPTRLADLPADTDVFVVFGGTNDDWQHRLHGYNDIGSPKYADWTDNDKKSFAPAFCYLLDYLKTHWPDAKIVVLINQVSANEDDISEPYATAMRTIAAYYGALAVQLTGVEKDNWHPTATGMATIANQLNAAWDNADWEALAAAAGGEDEEQGEGEDQDEDPEASSDVYLQSTGQEYIKTGVLPTENTRVIVDYQRAGEGGASDLAQHIMGIDINTAQFALGRARTKNSDPWRFVVCCNQGLDWAKQGYDFDDAERTTVELRGNGQVFVNGVEQATDSGNICSIGTAFSGYANDPKGGIYLFANNENLPGWGTKYYMSAKLYSCKIYEGETLIRNFVPHKQGDEVGLRDLCVTDSVSFYGNASGNGGFTTNYEPSNAQREELKSDDWKRFKYASTIDFENCGITDDAPLTNATVLLRLSSISGFSAADCEVDYVPYLAFASCNDGAWLDSDIDCWSSTRGYLAWVRIPLLSAKTKVKMYWGLKEGMSAGLDTSAATWTNSNYATVLHMNGTGGYDSVGGTEVVFNNASSGEGQVGNSALVTNNGKIELPYKATAPWVQALVASEVTLSFWMRADAASYSWPFFVEWGLPNGGTGKGFWIGGEFGTSSTVDGHAFWQGCNAAAADGYMTAATAGVDWPDGSTYHQKWIYYTISCKSENGQVHEVHYVDGQEVLATTMDLIDKTKNFIIAPTGTGTLTLMNNSAKGRGFGNARMDEFRISTIIRSAAEVAADYRMMTDPSFATYGARTKASAPRPSGLMIIVR